MDKTGLLDNRSKLTPRQSMQSIINYARQQDSRILVRNSITVRSHSLLVLLVFTPIQFYLNLFGGYWPSIYPRTMAENALELGPNNKKMYLVPEIYMKDLQRYKKDLKLKDTQQIRKSLTS